MEHSARAHQQSREADKQSVYFATKQARRRGKPTESYFVAVTSLLQLWRYDAIQKAKELNPDLIILDLSMPQMNEIEAARVLKKILPQTPIMMLTSRDPSTLGYDTHAAGIDGDGDMSLLMASLQSLLQEA